MRKEGGGLEAEHTSARTDPAANGGEIGARPGCLRPARTRCRSRRRFELPVKPNRLAWVHKRRRHHSRAAIKRRSAHRCEARTALRRVRCRFKESLAWSIPMTMS